MATVYLHSLALEDPKASSWDRGAYEYLKASALHNKPPKHTLTPDPKRADLILFADLGTTSGPFDEYIRYHPLYTAYKHKVYVFINRDSPFHVIPGLYTGLDNYFHFPWARAGFYVSQRDNPFLQYLPWNDHAPYLYSFVGGVCNHPVRSTLSTVQDPRYYFQDTQRLYVEASSQGKEDRLTALRQNFVHTLNQSKFVLCPRGLCSSSLRTFEVMQAGRVPVILSNAWVAPQGPDWSSFCLRVPEEEAADLPQLLRQKEDQAPAMAQKARQAWEAYYAENTLFQTIINDCLAIHSQQGSWVYKGSSALKWLQLLRPSLAKRYLRERISLYHERGRWYF